MATIKYKQNGTTYSCWSSTGRVTTPSLCFKDGSTTKYVPLFAVGNGEEGSSGNFYFRVGGLCANYNGTTYRAAVSRRYASSIWNTIYCNISHSGATGTSTTTQYQTINKSGTTTVKSGYVTGSGEMSKTVTVEYGVTFTGTPSVSVDGGVYCRLSRVGTSSCAITITAYYSGSGSSPSNHSRDVSWSISATGNVITTVTTYPDETKSAWAAGRFSYGVTYPSPPSLWVNHGDVGVWNVDNWACDVGKTLWGTVAYGQTITLSQYFGVSFSGDI